MRKDYLRESDFDESPLNREEVVDRLIGKLLVAFIVALLVTLLWTAQGT
jgi:hypothetical protein